MADFTGVGDNTELQMSARGESVAIVLSGTYVMKILFQREVGAPGSGAWETLRTYETDDETVADTHTTSRDNEKLRLIVDVDTSGTAVNSLTDSAFEDVGPEYRDEQGNVLMTFNQAGVVFPKALKAGPPIAGTTMTLTEREHAGRTIVFPAAGGTVTLPAATGSGAIYRFYVKILLTTSLVIQVANATDVMNGVLAVVTDIAGVVSQADIGDDTITLNKTTTGGLAGSYVEIEDVAAGFFRVTGMVVSSGTEDTPFTAAVS